jgi:hypothetical protein
MDFSDDHGNGYIAMPLPVVQGSVDYQSYKLLLRKIDQILRQSGMEKELEDICVKAKKEEIKKEDRKAIFRKIRKQLLTVSAHGERYLEKLRSDGNNQGLSKSQVGVIDRKLSHTLGLVPAAIHQASERIIGERQVPNEDKILSIHEAHAQVYNRGKGGRKSSLACNCS